MENEVPQKLDSESLKKIAIAECTIKDRNFVITTDKKIFVKCEDGSYEECLEDDEDVSILRRYTKPPKSLDIER